MNTETEERDTARSQARAQFEHIQVLMERLEHANDCTDDDCKECGNDGESRDDYHDEDKAREAITENALDCQVRSDWESSREDFHASEFNILLCTGGPAVRILGELDSYGQVNRAWIQYQDWGTPWTDLYIKDSAATIKEYAQQFYFGE